LPSSSSSSSSSASSIAEGTESASVMENLLAAIERENSQHGLVLRTFTAAHFQFQQELWKVLKDQRANATIIDIGDTTFPTILADLVIVLIRLVARSAHSAVIISTLDMVNGEFAPASVDSPSSALDPAYTIAASLILDKLVADFEGLVHSVLLSPDSMVRTKFAELFHRIYTIVATDVGAQGFVVLDESGLQLEVMSSNYRVFRDATGTAGIELGSKGGGYAETKGSIIPNTDAMSDDEQLAAALKLSQEDTKTHSGFETKSAEAMTEDEQLAAALALSQQEYATDITATILSSASAASIDLTGFSDTKTPAASVSAAAASAAVVETYPAVVRFLWELTTDKRIQAIADQWRRSDAVTWLFLKLAELAPQVQYIFVRREVIAQFADIVLSDQSPLAETLYSKSQRKRAPSSYVTIHPIKPNGELQATSKNIPDWSNLLGAIAILLRGSYPAVPHGPALGEWDRLCLKNKQFHATCLRQYRYSQPFISILRLLPMLDTGNVIAAGDSGYI
jgi:Ubiquitin interaction motif